MRSKVNLSLLHWKSNKKQQDKKIMFIVKFYHSLYRHQIKNIDLHDKFVEVFVIEKNTFFQIVNEKYTVLHFTLAF
jgi:hypothetical protein